MTDTARATRDGRRPDHAVAAWRGHEPRACIERGRLWQAEHYVGAVRDHALSLACLRQGLPAVQARGYDDLPAETLARFEDAHVASLEPGALRTALAASVRALTREGDEARLPHADAVVQRLAELGDGRNESGH